MNEGAPKTELDPITIDTIRAIIEPIPNVYSYDRVRAIVAKIGARAIQSLQEDLRHAPKGQLKKAVESWYQKFEQK